MGTNRLDGRPSPTSPLWHAEDATLVLACACGRQENLRVRDLFRGQHRDEVLWRLVSRLRCGCGARPRALDVSTTLTPTRYAWAERMTVEQAARNGLRLRPCCLQCGHLGAEIAAQSLVGRHGSRTLMQISKRLRCQSCDRVGHVGVHSYPAGMPFRPAQPRLPIQAPPPSPAAEASPGLVMGEDGAGGGVGQAVGAADQDGPPGAAGVSPAASPGAAAQQQQGPEPHHDPPHPGPPVC
jgi:hypothetical protein